MSKAKEIAVGEIDRFLEEMKLFKKTSLRYKDLEKAVDWLKDFVYNDIKSPAPNVVAKLSAHRIAKGM